MKKINYLKLEQEIIKNTLKFTYKDIINEMDENIKDFQSFSDYYRLREKLVTNKDKIKKIDFSLIGNSVLSYEIDYESGELLEVYNYDFSFVYDNKEHKLLLESWTNSDFKKVF